MTLINKERVTNMTGIRGMMGESDDRSSPMGSLLDFQQIHGFRKDEKEKRNKV